ncbi:MAG: B12-binding domain-containing radical SAM protein [Acidobacteriota bacterium]|nr:B12-binding domain-containing radical SAM protein [Acidobacteriota bacterium]
MSASKHARIMLITPPYHSGMVESAGSWLPLGLLYVGGALRKAGHEVVLYDAMTKFDTLDEVRSTIRRERPDAVFVSCITATFPDGVEVCRVTKEECPETLTVVGNTHPTFMWKETLDQYPEVDVIVRGEGEVTSVDLMAAWTENAAFREVKGIAFRDENQQPVATPTRPFMEDLDTAEPAWELVPWAEYSYRPKPGSTLAVVSSSRGCKQQCSFCSQRLFWKEGWRAVSAHRFVDQLEHLRDSYGVDVVMLADEIPSYDRERWQKILDLLIERRLGTSLLLETRVDDILRDAEILPRYREAGVEHIYVGVESVNQATLDLFKKDLKIEQSKRAIELINNCDMVSETSFVMGMPEETEEEMDRTIELSKYYDPDMAFFLAITPWPYADLYPLVKDRIVTTDYRKYNLAEPVIEPFAMSIDQVREKLFEGFREFYTHKMRQIPTMPEWKREFMGSLMHLFMNHSYLKDQMAALGHPPQILDSGSSNS